MSLKIVKLTASSAFQDIGTVGQTVAQLAGNMQSVNQILDVGLRNTKNFADSFVRQSDLVGLGVAALDGNQLTSKVNNSIYPPCVVNALPPAITGDRGFVTDATSTTFAAAPVGGGSHSVPVVYTGSGWIIG